MHAAARSLARRLTHWSAHGRPGHRPRRRRRRAAPRSGHRARPPTATLRLPTQRDTGTVPTSHTDRSTGDRRPDRPSTRS